jgi:surface polysaccharide O-acyltransferase-like enzyme
MESPLELVKFAFFKLTMGSYYHLWFVYVLIGLYLFVPILRKWVRDASRAELRYFLIIWFITILAAIPQVGRFLPNISLINFAGYAGYLVLGYYLSKTEVRNLTIPVAMVIIGFLITAGGTYFESHRRGDFYVEFYEYLAPNVLLSAAGVFMIFKGISIKNELVTKRIRLISEHSFGIYLAHPLVLALFEMLGFNWEFVHPALGIPLVSVCSLLVSLLVIALMKTAKFGRLVAG